MQVNVKQNGEQSTSFSATQKAKDVSSYAVFGMMDQIDDLFGYATRPTLLGTFPGQPLQVFDQTHPRRRDLFGILVPQFIQLKRTTVGNLTCTLNRVGNITIQISDLGQRSQMPL